MRNDYTEILVETLQLLKRLSTLHLDFSDAIIMNKSVNSILEFFGELESSGTLRSLLLNFSISDEKFDKNKVQTEYIVLDFANFA